jgi:multicomponent Na+:H+ antiporter subunit A
MLASIVLLMLAAAPLGLFARREPRSLIGWGLALIPFAAFLALGTQIPLIVNGGRIDEALAWAPAMGLELRFTLDGLSLLFALIITGIGTLIIGYGGAYMEKDSGLGRFYVYLLLFMGAMLGLVLAGNVLTMFVFWELTSVTSYLLIGYKHDYPDARRGAQHSLLITGGGGLALLVGLLLLGYMTQQTGVTGSEAYTFAAIIAAGDALKLDALYTPALILVFLGCFTKSAQFPFHFWLPGAMQAPTPASAFLHSATMVKAGVYLLARLAPGLGGTVLWDTTLILVGGFTFAFGGIVAVRQYDIKALLAYTTLSMLGGLVMLIGLGGKYGAEALTANILAHALYKSALFMTAGIIDHETGTRDLNRLGGLRKYMPITMAIVGVALISQMGIPILLGFVAKEWMLKAALESSVAAPLPTIALIAIIVGALAYIVAAWRLFSKAFLGTPHPDVRQHHVVDPKPAMWISPGVPALLSLALPLGLLPAVSALLSPAASNVYGEAFTFELYLYNGVNTALLISLSIIAVGLVLTRVQEPLATLRGPFGKIDAAIVFDKLIDGMLATATTMTRTIQSGKLRTYILYTVLTFIGFVGVPFVLFGLNGITVTVDNDLHFYEVLTAALIPVGVIATIRARSRLGAIISVSVVGAMIALFFVLFSAPDLAITQLLIEALSTVFLILVFSVLPTRFETLSPLWVRVRDGIIAGVAGLLLMGLVLAATTSDLFRPLAPWFLANSYPAGQGDNVVNVILVDFRGFDTLGEITVLFVALLGIYGLLRFRTKPVAKPASDNLPVLIPGELQREALQTPAEVGARGAQLGNAASRQPLTEQGD